MTVKTDDEPKHATHESAGPSEKQAIPPLPANWKADAVVIPGYETEPVGVLSLQPEAQKAHEARVKEAAKEAEKKNGK